MAFGYVEQLQVGLMDPGHPFHQPDDKTFLANVGAALDRARPVLATRAPPRD